MDILNDDSQRRIQTACLLFLAVAVGTFMVYWLRPVLVPLVVALFVVSGVTPILRTLERRLGVSRIVAAALTFLAGVFILVIFGLTIWVSVIDLSTNASAYRQRVREIVGEVQERIPVHFFEQDPDPEDGVSPTDQRFEQSSQYIDAFVRNGIATISQALVGLVSTSVIVLVYVFFLLIGTTSIQNATETMREVDVQVRSYLSLKTVISIFTGLAFGLALRLFGVPMAFTFGVMAFLLNFVPNVGPIVASLLPIPLILLDPEGSVGWMVAVIAVTGTIQLVSGNIVEPKIMGNSSDLHPVSILAALMFWGMLWGVIGMFLATPMTAALKIMLERIDQTRPIANLMAGRFEDKSIKEAFE